MSTVKAIETHYAGCRFRSRLEARWAVFFDALGIPWQYEPEGYELPSGRYLPDFWLPQQRTFYEVKGTEPTDREVQLATELQEATGHKFVIAWGDIPYAPGPNGYDDQSRGGNAGTRGMVAYCDFDYAWTTCSSRKHYGVEYEARGARVACDCEVYHSDKDYRGDDPRLAAAFAAARTARFEFGKGVERQALVDLEWSGVAESHRARAREQRQNRKDRRELERLKMRRAWAAERRVFLGTFMASLAPDTEVTAEEFAMVANCTPEALRGHYWRDGEFDLVLALEQQGVKVWDLTPAAINAVNHCIKWMSSPPVPGRRRRRELPPLPTNSELGWQPHQLDLITPKITDKMQACVDDVGYVPNIIVATETGLENLDDDVPKAVAYLLGIRSKFRA